MKKVNSENKKMIGDGETRSGHGVTKLQVGITTVVADANLIVYTAYQSLGKGTILNRTKPLR